MAKNISEEVFDEILEDSAEILKVRGFVRRGPVFRLVNRNKCGIIEFQRSDESSSEKVVFTINLGIVCGELLDSGPSSAAKSHIIDAHLRQRLGMLLPDRSDKWWEASPDRASVAQEIVGLLSTVAVPYVESHMATEALIALWESGQSPGLTAVQRTRYLSKLKAARSR